MIGRPPWRMRSQADGFVICSAPSCWTWLVIPNAIYEPGNWYYCDEHKDLERKRNGQTHSA